MPEDVNGPGLVPIARCAQSVALSSDGRAAISFKSRSRRTADSSGARTGGLGGFAAPRARPLRWLLGGGSGHGFKHGPALGQGGALGENHGDRIGEI